MVIFLFSFRRPIRCPTKKQNMKDVEHDDSDLCVLVFLFCVCVCV